MYLFFIILRPTGSRGFANDRCQWQMQGVGEGEKQGVHRPNCMRESGRLCFEVGLRRFKSCLRNSIKKMASYCKVWCYFFDCAKMYHAVSDIRGPHALVHGVDCKSCLRNFSKERYENVSLFYYPATDGFPGICQQKNNTILSKHDAVFILLFFCFKKYYL